MSSRRSHRKSRTGCYQCKRRRIKCDESPAPCGNCRKHNVFDCQFPNQPPNPYYASFVPLPSTQAETTSDSPAAAIAPVGPASGPTDTPITPAASAPRHTPTLPPTTTASNQFRTIAPSATQLPAILNQGPPPSPAWTSRIERHSIFSSVPDRFQEDKSLNLEDLELLHHYTTKTYQTLSNNNEHEDIWKNVIPGEAIKHPFLMHGLLALAALHIIECHDPDDEESRRKYSALANKHQNLALATFRPELNNITPLNCHAVFAFSSLIAALAFAFSRSERCSNPADYIEQAVQDFYLFRGVDKVLHTQWTRIIKGKLGALVRRPADSSAAYPLSKDVIDTLDYLHSCNGETAGHIPAEERAIYNHAIRELRMSFERTPSSWEGVFRWPMVVPEPYLGLLHTRKPMALVILGHYCVILSRLDMCWWSEGWSRHLFEAIYKSLHPSWRTLVQWPMQMIGLSESLAHVP
ncbi:hypothetical protein MGYG_07786 [Nannizzia gypsea CBS 118893]|uniref:Zn(2)-C6 fungal-type domain-containing protein n=1 Tax=Arthroderma gypseum (strain ATCC MYA-4604 / CBS 118893) TaxID=535722 RepID=E4V455_ARTGP|nr:hypothetical protein MGYG_07786 [Nannizzia gypsea CBS 118893]EFR04779.1 hypothetical protein MGYG_07786 [Nannizzia gypsea CBS 118893]